MEQVQSVAESGHWQQKAIDHSLRIFNVVDGKVTQPEGESQVEKAFSGDGRHLYTFGSGTTAKGTELLFGGRQVKRDSGGYYAEPTVFDHVDPNHTIAEEGSFGPVLSVFTFEGEGVTGHRKLTTLFGQNY